jgi:hypothetical protein
MVLHRGGLNRRVSFPGSPHDQAALPLRVADSELLDSDLDRRPGASTWPKCRPLAPSSVIRRDRYETLAICRTLALARAAFAAVIGEKPPATRREIGENVPRVLNLKDCDYEVPPGAVYIGRADSRYRLLESKWANPYKVRKRTCGEHERVVAEFELHLQESGLIAEVHELRGLDLVSWCHPWPCHGDVLLRRANA